MTIAQGTILKAVSTMNVSTGIVAQNVWYWRVQGINPVSETATMTQIKGAIEDFFDELANQIKDTCSLDDVIVHEWDYDATEGWHTGTYIGTSTLADTFAETDQLLPPQCAAVITGVTNDVKCLSRKSVAGFVENEQGAGDLIAAAVTALTLAATQWMADRTIAGSDHLSPGVPKKDGTWEPLVSAIVGTLVGSQRQRKLGIGI